MKLGRGTLKRLLIILIFLGAVLGLPAQETSSDSQSDTKSSSQTAANDGTKSGTPSARVDEESLLLFPDADEAQSPAAAAPEETVPPSVGLGDLFRVIIVLAAVIGLIYLLVYLLKKVTPMTENSEERISLLATRHLKRDASLHLVEVGSQVFLIGSGSSSVNLISEITDQETLDRLRLEETGRKPVPGGGFRNLLRRGLAAGAASSAGGGKKLTEQSADFLKSQRNRLRNLEDRE